MTKAKDTSHILQSFSDKASYFLMTSLSFEFIEFALD